MRKYMLGTVGLVLILSCWPAAEPPPPVEVQVPVEVTRVVVETQVVEGAPVEVTRIVRKR